MAHEHRVQRGVSEQSARGEAQQEPEIKSETTNTIGGAAYACGPFAAMRRLSDSVDKLFSSFFSPGSAPADSDDTFATQNDVTEAPPWPEIEVRHNGTRFLVHAVIAGLKKEDLRIEVRDHALSISVARRSGSDERSYCSFRRAIPLPRGADVDSASASFEGGVLRIELDVPNSMEPSRNIEVRDGSG